MTSEEPTGEAGIIQMFTGTSLPSLWASPSPVAFPEGPGSVHLTIFMFLTSASKTCARLQARRLPRCESGLKVSKCSGKTDMGPEEGRASGLNVVTGIICLEG